MCFNLKMHNSVLKKYEHIFVKFSKQVKLTVLVMFYKLIKEYSHVILHVIQSSDGYYSDILREILQTSLNA